MSKRNSPEYAREYYAANKARIKAWHKGWRERNPEKIKQYKENYEKKYPDLRKQRQAKYREDNLNIIKQSQVRYRQSPQGFAGELVRTAKRRAERCGLPFNLEVAHLLPQLTLGVCEITGIPFHKQARMQGAFTPSLDRIDPAKGYVKGNVQVVIWALNAMRGTWGDDVLLQVADALKASR